MKQQQGAVLIVALALMMILAMLASSGMRLSIAELLMAGNEQFRHAASMSASSGIEAAIARIAGGVVPASADTLEGQGFTVTIRYAGDEANLPGSSVGKLVGHHYELTSVGTSSRLARDEQVQGIMVVDAVAGGVATFRRLGGGLASEAAP